MVARKQQEKRELEAKKQALLKKNPSLIYDEVGLKNLAEEQGYGYKTANLKLMSELFLAINFKEKHGYNVEVPGFAGISSQEIQAFLKTQGLDVEAVWNEIKQEHKLNNSETQQNAFQTKNFPKGFIDQVKLRLEEKINTIFSKLEEKLPEFTSETVKEIDKLLQESKTKNNKLMVRSTGKEDTATLANAGGNESVANVDPENMKNILDALREVVASYYREKSLKQRLGAGDKSLFVEAPFTPAVIQRMIGEVPGGVQKLGKSQSLFKVPRCGVMFTEEAEGSVSRYMKKNSNTGVIEDKDPQDPKRIATSGITLIQAAYGHNEGVVNSLVAVDSYYVDRTGNIYPVIKTKRSRFVPKIVTKVGENPLERQDNPLLLQKMPALEEAQIQTLKMLADTLENYYQKPMDVEYVVDPATKTVYVVQARPIVHVLSADKPSYWKDPSKIKETVSGSSIGVAGGVLRVVTKSSECIIAATLPLALKKYQEDATDKPSIKCVLIGEDAPATSHEATAFRSEGKPVMFLKGLSTIEEWLKNLGTETLVVDVQRELVMKLNKKIEKNDTIDGWINYPIPAVVSAHFFDKAQRNVLLAKLSSVQKDVSAPKKEDRQKVSAILESLKTTGGLEDLESLVKIEAGMMQAHLKALANSADKSLKDEIGTWLAMLIRCRDHIKLFLKLTPENKFYVQRLYPVRFLQALLTQQVDQDEFLETTSAVVLDRVMKQEKKIITSGSQGSGETKDQQLGLQLLAAHGKTEDTKKSWTTFVGEFFKQQKNPAIQKQFLEMVASLSRLKISPEWLNTSFAQTKNQSIMDRAMTLMDEFEEAAPFLQVLFEKNNRLHEYELDVLEDPSKFDKAWKDFKSFLQWFMSSEKDGFITLFASTSDLGKAAATKVMHAVVDIFDNGIKAVTGSSRYKKPSEFSLDKAESKENKAYRFKEMLHSYLGLLEGWITLKGVSLKSNALWDSKKVTSMVKTKLTTTSINNDDQLSIAGTFSVNAVKLGQEVDYSVPAMQPTRLEEIFTFTHQSLIEVMGNISGSTAQVESSADIQAVYDIVQVINPTNNDKGNDRHNVFTTTPKGNHYTVTLRSHAATVDVEYTASTKDCLITMDMTGEDEGGRFYRCIDFAILAAKIMNIELVKASVNGKQCSYTWKLSLSKPLPEGFKKYLKASIGYSWATDGLYNVKSLEQGLLNNTEQGDYSYAIGAYNRSLISKKDQQNAIEAVVVLSLNGAYINMFMVPVLNKLVSDSAFVNVDLLEKLLKILERLYSDKKFKDNSEFRLFKRVHDPTIFVKVHSIGEKYYSVTEENYSAKKNEIDQHQNGVHQDEKAYENVYEQRLWSFLDAHKQELPQDQQGRFNQLAKTPITTGPQPLKTSANQAENPPEVVGPKVVALKGAQYQPGAVASVISGPIYQTPGTDASILKDMLKDAGSKLFKNRDLVKAKLLQIVQDTGIWDKMFPQHIDDLVQIGEIVKKLAKKETLVASDLANYASTGAKRQVLATIFLLLLIDYKDTTFLTTSTSKILEHVMGQSQYSSVAMKAFDQLKKNLESKKYNPSEKQAISNACNTSGNAKATELKALAS